MNRILAVLIVLVGLVPSSRAEQELFTNVYVVPLVYDSDDSGKKGGNKGGIKNALEEAGIVFGPGASAVYNPTNGQLIVRNTHKQLALVEAYIKAIVQSAEKQIYVSVREASFQGELSEHLKNTLSSYFEFPEPPVGRKEGEWAGVFDSYDSFKEELARPPKPMEEVRAERRIRVAGTLTDPQFQVFIRSLEQIEGVEILSPPSVMARSGQPIITRTEQRRYGVVPVLGADEFAIDLDLFLPEHGKALSGEETSVLKPTGRVTIGDGGTVVVAEERANGPNRLVFVKAHIMDPAGMPVQRKPEETPSDQTPIVRESRIQPPKKAAEAVELPAKSGPETLSERPWFPLPAVELPSKTEPEPLGAEEAEAVKQVDELLAKAHGTLKQADFAAAIKGYAKALEILSGSEATEPRRRAIEEQLKQAQENLMRISTSGMYRVCGGESLEEIAVRFGIDPGLLRRTNHLGETPVRPNQLLLLPPGTTATSPTERLLRDFIIPSVEFSDLALVEALAIVQEEILERRHDPDLFPEAAPILILDVPEETLSSLITLRLSNVPAIEAIRYVVSLANCHFEVVEREVRISPLPISHLRKRREPLPPSDGRGAAIGPPKDGL